MIKGFFRVITFLSIIAAAVFYVVTQVNSSTPSEHQNLQYPSKMVEIITAKKIPFRARSIAYGNVEPAAVLSAKAEVGGKISYLHPDLKKGGSIAKGTVVLRIEPTTYKFSVDTNKAGLASSQSSLKQLEVEEKSTKRSLNIAQKNLRVGLIELNRVRKVWKKRLIARSTVDTEEQRVLLLRQTVEDKQGKLATYASRKNAARAQINQSKTKIAESKDTLGRTEVRLPFDARIGKVSVEKGGFTAIGNVLFEASGTDAIEINAQLPTQYFQPLLGGLANTSFDLKKPKGLQSAISKMKLDVSVSLVGDKNNTQWQGKLLRISESVDPTRDTAGLVVAVDNPYQGIIPGKRPPLLKGMYMAVEFIAPAKKRLVLPRKAIHQGRVYVANEKNQLEIRNVNILFKQGQLVIIESGIEENEQVIISDVIPVINGLPLETVHSTDFEKQLVRDALGMKEGTVKDSKEAVK